MSETARSTGRAPPRTPSAPATDRQLDALPSRDGPGLREAHAFAVEAARLMSDDKALDVVVLDVSKLSQVTDYIVIGSGTSERQMRSVLQHVQELGGSRGYPVFRASADERANWLLADFVDVVVHLFEPNTRAHYDLEMLWGDAPHLGWERTGPGGPSRNRAGLAPGDQAGA